MQRKIQRNFNDFKYAIPVRGFRSLRLLYVVVVVDCVAAVVVVAVLHLEVVEERLVGVVAVAGLEGKVKR